MDFPSAPADEHESVVLLSPTQNLALYNKHARPNKKQWSVTSTVLNFICNTVSDYGWTHVRVTGHQCLLFLSPMKHRV